MAQILARDEFMLPVSRVFHTVVTMSIGLKNVLRVRASTLQYTKEKTTHLLYSQKFNDKALSLKVQLVNKEQV